MQETLNPKSETLNKLKIQNPKRFDLADRTLSFSKRVLAYVSFLPKNLANNEIAKQLLRSVGSIGANYIEAEEALSRKDFVMRIKISRKEAKETIYWLNLVAPSDNRAAETQALIQEATELMKIFGAIAEKSK